MYTIIKASNIAKHYWNSTCEVTALEDITINIKEKAIVGIIGPSGSGKSTLLNILGCLDKPTKGEVIVKNISTKGLTSNTLAEIRNQNIGFIFQQFHLIPNLTTLENVILPLYFRNDFNIIEAELKAKNVLEKVGLINRLNHKPNELSGGEQQRTAIARALINNPEIIIADEPTGNLDSKTGEKIIELILELNKQGRTLIIATHKENLLSIMKQKIKLKDGKIINND